MSTPGSSARRRNARGEGQRLRAEILATTVALMATGGTDETLTLRGVAREVGVAPPSVYRHFRGLDELLAAAVAEILGSLRAEMEAAVEEVADPVERLLERARAYVRWGDARPGLYRVVFEGRTQRSEQIPAGRAIRLTAEEDLRAAMARGALPPADPSEIAFALWAVLHGIVSLRANKPGAPWPTAERFVDVAVPRLLGLPRA
ncbi:MAG: TetR/AcrR family transcriptional regulator [Kineosporiaceae bacterium]